MGVYEKFSFTINPAQGTVVGIELHVSNLNSRIYYFLPPDKRSFMPIKLPAPQPRNKTLCCKRNIFKLLTGPLDTSLPKPHQGSVLFNPSGDV